MSRILRTCATGEVVYSTPVAARIDADAVIREADPGTRKKLARVVTCKHCSSWHIRIPTEQAWKTVRKRARRAEQDIAEGKNASREGRKALRTLDLAQASKK